MASLDREEPEAAVVLKGQDPIKVQEEVPDMDERMAPKSKDLLRTTAPTRELETPAKIRRPIKEQGEAPPLENKIQRIRH